jgi:hypothetical protein
LRRNGASLDGFKFLVAKPMGQRRSWSINLLLSPIVVDGID